MIKMFLLKYLKKLIIFLNNFLKIKSQPLSPAELYFEGCPKKAVKILRNILKRNHTFFLMMHL